MKAVAASVTLSGAVEREREGERRHRMNSFTLVNKAVYPKGNDYNWSNDSFLHNRFLNELNDWILNVQRML